MRSHSGPSARKCHSQGLSWASGPVPTPALKRRRTLNLEIGTSLLPDPFALGRAAGHSAKPAGRDDVCDPGEPPSRGLPVPVFEKRPLCLVPPSVPRSLGPS